MRTFTLSSADVARCPLLIMRAEHYWSNGMCKCLWPLLDGVEGEGI